MRRQQATVSPADITVLQNLNGNMERAPGVLYIAFVVGGKGGQTLPLTTAEMVDLLNAQGDMLADELSRLVCCVEY